MSSTGVPKVPAARRFFAPLTGVAAGLAATLALLAAGQVAATALGWIAPVLALAGGLIGWAAAPRPGRTSASIAASEGWPGRSDRCGGDGRQGDLGRAFCDIRGYQ